MSIRSKLFSVIIACIVAFVGFAWLSWDTVETTKVTGAHYQNIVTSKDLIADILPPPEYVVETYLVVYQIADETDRKRQADLVKRLATLKREYDERHAFWLGALPEGSLRTRFLVDSYEPAVEFFKLVEQRLLPAVEEDDRQEARDILRNELRPLYDKHRAAIEQVVTMADESLKREESAVATLVSNRKWSLILLGVVVMVGMLAGAAFMGRITSTIVRRLSDASGFATAMAKGDMTQSLPTGPRDEVGQLVVALNEMKSNMRTMVSEILRGSNTLNERANDLAKVSSQTTSNARDMVSKASLVAAAAEESSANAKSVAGSIGDTSHSLESVARATQQLSNTIAGIASNSSRARGISDDAARQSEEIRRAMRQLGEAANEIGKVTETIRSISAQTSLLALNATIEAARAGAAGKGFAVVANEVKELSQQAAAATEDIKAKVTSVQTSTESAVSDIEKIGQVVSEVSQIVADIASAVDRQSSMTRDVAQNIAQASAAVQEANKRVEESATVSHSIAKDVASVHASVTEIRESGDQVHGYAGDLDNLAKSLSRSVNQFKL